jgi:hypothetical protein
MAYGFKTLKSDGTTVILQNSSKSGVFGEAYTIGITGTAGQVTPVDFPKYTGRTLRVLQLKPGGHSWQVSYNNSIPRITFVQRYSPSIPLPAAFFGSTTVYIFVK